MTAHRFFLSYSHNLERVLGKGSVFLDEPDIGKGKRWHNGAQHALSEAERLVLVVTPEALASPCGEAEWEVFKEKDEGHARRGGIQLVKLVETTFPPFLSGVSPIDFRQTEDEAAYRMALAQLVAALRGATARRELPALRHPTACSTPTGAPGRDPTQPRASLALDRLARALIATSGRAASSSPRWPSTGWRASLARHPPQSLAARGREPHGGAVRLLEVLIDRFSEFEALLEPLPAIREKLRCASNERRSDDPLGSYCAWVAEQHTHLRTRVAPGQARVVARRWQGQGLLRILRTAWLSVRSAVELALAAAVGAGQRIEGRRELVCAARGAAERVILPASRSP